MNVTYMRDETSGRVTAMSLFAKDGVEEIFYQKPTECCAARRLMTRFPLRESMAKTG